jgi:NitT/TauT family transport system ATP-binding protein
VHDLIDPELTAEPRGGIQFSGVSKWFRRKGQVIHALSRIDLDIEPGSFVSLIGPSGCGKSTLLRLAGGLLDADRGSVVVEGETPAEALARKHYAFVPQQPALMPWRTVRRNVALLGETNRSAKMRGVSADARLELIEQMGLTPFLESYPRELSGGMQQRVSIARAFALGAPLMLMDEPFSALDEITRADMRYQLLELWERVGCTVLFVTHSIPEAVILSDRVVVLGARPGRITDIIDVGLARPRSEVMEDLDEFHAGVAEVRQALKQGSA